MLTYPTMVDMRTKRVACIRPISRRSTNGVVRTAIRMGVRAGKGAALEGNEKTFDIIIRANATFRARKGGTAGTRGAMSKGDMSAISWRCKKTTYLGALVRTDRVSAQSSPTPTTDRGTFTSQHLVTVLMNIISLYRLSPYTHRIRTMLSPSIAQFFLPGHEEPRCVICVISMAVGGPIRVAFSGDVYRSTNKAGGKPINKPTFGRVVHK